MGVKTEGRVTTGKRDDRPEEEKREEATAKAEGERAVRFEKEAAENDKLAKQGGRTDEEITCQAPLEIVLGGEKYEVSILAYNPLKKWRDAFRKRQEHQFELRDMTAGMKPEEFTREAMALTEVVVLDDKAELLALYLEMVPEFPIENVLDIATHDEILAAYKKVATIASPLSEAPAPRQL